MLNFFRKSAPAIEQKSLGNPSDEEIAVLTAGNGAAGSIGLGMALTVPAVQCAIRLISEAAASLDVKVMKAGADGEAEDKDHPVSILLKDQPNEWSSFYDLIRDLVATALTNDKGGLAWVNRVGDDIREIVRYEPAYYTVTYSADGRSEPSFEINNRAIEIGNIIHLRSPFSRSPLSLALDAINVAKLMEKHAGALFKNGARPSGVIEFEKGLGDEGLKKMKAGWKAAHEGADNAGKTAILWDGAKFRAMTLNSTDAQFLELRTFQIVEIARAFRVPPSMLYDLTRATWSNAEQMGREFLVYTLEPWLKSLEGALRRALFTPDERKLYRVVFDRDDLTRADIVQRATAYSSLISARVFNPNEIRGWEGAAPYDGGNEFKNPNIDLRQPAKPAPENAQ